ncbi:type VI secretion system tube protein TssD, partial [Bacteroides fragilis]
AYIVYYKEVYNVDRKRQMYSTITFSADIIMIGDAYLSNQW